MNIATTSETSFGVVHGFAANTHSGVRKHRNEDKISIVINPTPPNGEKWPQISYFGIFDGHGGED